MPTGFLAGTPGSGRTISMFVSQELVAVLAAVHWHSVEMLWNRPLQRPPRGESGSGHEEAMRRWASIFARSHVQLYLYQDRVSPSYTDWAMAVLGIL